MTCEILGFFDKLRGCFGILFYFCMALVFFTTELYNKNDYHLEWIAMNNNSSWDDLGRSIRDEVERAVNSQDFQNMARNVRQVIESAASTGTDAVRRVAQNVQLASTRNLYGKTGGKVVGGILKTFFGGVLTLGLTVGTVAALFTAGAVAAAAPAVMLAGSCWMLGSGVGTMRTVSRFRTYRRLLGKKTQCALYKLARAVGKDEAFVRRDVTKMIGSGYFLEGHLDHEQRNLIISDETYREFEQARLQLEQARKRQEERLNGQVQEVLDRGNAFIAQLRKCNDDIPGEEVSAKIDRMEQTVRRIFDRARAKPEVIPDLKKLMDYYLPMTVKLLNAYADMDAQPVQGETIASSKREIEATLDTLNAAFEKLFDELFQDTALDISSDITVLNTMLAREGLTEDELTKMRKQQNL